MRVVETRFVEDESDPPAAPVPTTEQPAANPEDSETGRHARATGAQVTNQYFPEEESDAPPPRKPVAKQASTNQDDSVTGKAQDLATSPSSKGYCAEDESDEPSRAPKRKASPGSCDTSPAKRQKTSADSSKDSELSAEDLVWVSSLFLPLITAP